MLPRLVKAAGTEPFSLHDLRRTCRTLMSRCGMDDLIAELAIGHARIGLVGVYNKDSALAGPSESLRGGLSSLSWV